MQSTVTATLSVIYFVFYGSSPLPRCFYTSEDQAKRMARFYVNEDFSGVKVKAVRDRENLDKVAEQLSQRWPSSELRREMDLIQQEQQHAMAKRIIWAWENPDS